MHARLFALLLALTAGLASCGGTVNESDQPDGASRTITGVLIDIDSTTIDQINGFTLKSGDERFEVLIDEEITYGFPLGHLQEHLQDALPVRVEMESRNGELYALSIEDA